MAFFHGVKTQELPTSIISPARTEAGLPVIIGTAPVHLTSDIKNVNKPVLCYSYAEAIESFGYSSDWEKFTLCEFIYSQFVLFAMSPCVLINAFDPAKHKEVVNAHLRFVVPGNEVALGENIYDNDKFVLASTGQVDDTSRVVYSRGVDYDLSYSDAHELLIEIKPDGALSDKSEAYVTYEQAAPASVSAADIIAAIEQVNRVFPKFRLVPGLIAAPGFSDKPEVMAAMVARAQNINGIFNAQAVCDLPSSIAKYSDVPEWKNANNYADEHLIACWPKVALGSQVFHMSTQLIGLMNSVDAGNEDVPYESPSNKNLQMNACVNDSGEVSLGLDEANYLNSQGIVTALNWSGGWKAWGNRTCAYPAVTDIKDAMIPVRRMFDWIRNNFILTFWQKVDGPITRRLIKTIINSYNVYLNGLQAREMILGGRIEFQDTDNPTTDLLDGILRFHIYFTPPAPAEQIIGIFEYDVDYFNELFA